jgi:hypothetical protein
MAAIYVIDVRAHSKSLIGYLPVSIWYIVTVLYNGFRDSPAWSSSYWPAKRRQHLTHAASSPYLTMSPSNSPRSYSCCLTRIHSLCTYKHQVSSTKYLHSLLTSNDFIPLIPTTVIHLSMKHQAKTLPWIAKSTASRSPPQPHGSFRSATPTTTSS